MSARRCPSCGGLVGRDAEWCGQCLTRLVDPEAPPRAAQGSSAGADAPRLGAPGSSGADETPSAGDGRATGGGTTAAEAGGRAVRSTEDGIVWDCPTCGEVNPIEEPSCRVCGTPFGRLFESPDTEPGVEPGRAATLSLFYPGAGHIALGRRAEGIARAVIFTFALATGLLTLFAERGGGLFSAVLVVSLAAAAALYVLSTLDAGRAAQGLPPIVSMRILLYGAVGLMLLTMTLLTMAALQARG